MPRPGLRRGGGGSMAQRSKTGKAKGKAQRSPARSARKPRPAPAREVERRLAEALEQQEATAEILRVISSSPTDVQPVFDTIVRAAVILCGGAFGNVQRFDGEFMHLAAHYHHSPEWLDAMKRLYPRRIDRT